MKKEELELKDTINTVLSNFPRYLFLNKEKENYTLTVIDDLSHLVSKDLYLNYNNSIVYIKYVLKNTPYIFYIKRIYEKSLSHLVYVLLDEFLNIWRLVSLELWSKNQATKKLQSRYDNQTYTFYFEKNNNIIDKFTCMSEFLAFRFIKDENINFYNGLSHTVYKPREEKEVTAVYTTDDMDKIIREKIEEFYIPNKTAILLSGGMDSAILASYLPKGTKAYTFHCIAEGAIDERAQAKKYCDAYGLDQEIIEMNWSDFEELTPEILEKNGVPFHSIEVMLYKAAKYAKSQGIERIIIGDAADYIFGGMDRILSKDWTFDEFYNRFNYINPKEVLIDGQSVKDVYEPYRLENDKIDFQKMMKDIMDIESDTSYMHAFNNAGIEYLDPYSYMKMGEPLDLNRVRNGEPKYMIRELFAKRYPNIPIPNKIPMPRATTQWLKDYKVTRPEFIPNCTENMTGDQKWLCWCLEQFLNMHEPVKGGNNE